MRSTVEARNTGIDLFRGALVLAVMLGHFSELSQRHGFFTWLGYGFRMPLFIGLTGYLFNLERARMMPLLALLRKYHRRLVFPWLVACLVHLTITQQLTYLTPIAIVLRPPFHLWFVPVMMTFIMLAAVNRLGRPAMLAIAIPASIAAMYMLGVVHGSAHHDWWMPDRRFFIYPIYFFFGLWLAKRELPSRAARGVALLLALIGLLWWCKLYNQPAPAAEVAAELILCIPLISLLPRVRELNLHMPSVTSIGRDSLFYYLWHPLAFGLWASCGVIGLPMLLLSLVSLVLARLLIGRVPSIAGVFGLMPVGPARSEPVPLGQVS